MWRKKCTRIIELFCMNELVKKGTIQEVTKLLLGSMPLDIPNLISYLGY